MRPKARRRARSSALPGARLLAIPRALPEAQGAHVAQSESDRKGERGRERFSLSRQSHVGHCHHSCWQCPFGVPARCLVALHRGVLREGMGCRQMIFTMKTVVEPQVEDINVPLTGNMMQNIMKRPSAGWNIEFHVLDTDTSHSITYRFTGTRLSAPVEPQRLSDDDLQYLYAMRNELNRILGDE